MSYKILTTAHFLKQLKHLKKKYPSIVSDLLKLENELAKNPTMGTPLGKNCYKIRVAISAKGKGKSGGSRVITFVVFSSSTIYLLAIYDKSEKESLSSVELKELISLIN